MAQQWVSLDGYASGTGGEDALFAHVHSEADERSQRYNVELCSTVHHVLLGRRTYGSFVSYWPTATETIAETVNAMPKVVASRSLTHAPWPTGSRPRLLPMSSSMSVGPATTEPATS